MSGIPERVWKLKLPCHVDNAIMKHMETIIKKIDRNQIDQVIMEEAGSILKNGGLVAFPTETVYGLGANALDEEAAKKTYAAKGRPSDNPLIVHIARLEDLGAIVESVPLIVDEIAAHFWPGPLTMIFNKNEKVPLGTTGGLETVAVRMPDDEIARELILAGGGYVSAPSANTSGRPSPTTAQHVAEDLSGKIEMILDGGSVDIGVESTILDMTVTPPMILRPGAITKEMLSEVIGEVAVDETLISENSTKAPKAPGMKYRHYAPKAEMIIVDGEPEEAVRAIKQIAYEQVRLGYKVGIIASNESVDQYTTGVVKCIGSRVNEKTVARNLYKVLREFDEEEVDYIYSEAFPEAGIGTAIMNRLGKAAGHHVLQASEITKLQDYRRIVFVSNSANCRAPIAAAILKKQPLFQEYEVCARGLVVLFPEPLNPRAEELLARHHIETEGYETVALSEEEFGEDTLVLAMQDSIKQKIQNDYPGKGQVYTLSAIELEKDSPLSLARDIFMFSFYTRGMSFVDIALLKKRHVFPGEICYRRHKTDQLMRVGINKEISRILERYKNVPGEYIFPLFPAERDPYAGYRSAYHRIRYSLGKISRVIGLEFPLRLHAARHSWATIAKVNGASVHVIGECLGHTSEKTTRIYLKELDHSALDAVNNQVADFILAVDD